MPATPKKPITILHLSDIHYGDDILLHLVSKRRSVWKRPSSGIRKGLRDAIRKIVPKYVILSGDFVNKPKRKCFAESALFLRDLLVDSGIDIQKQVLAVPGNHDVPFIGAKPDEAERLSLYREFIKLLFGHPVPDTGAPNFLKACVDDELLFLAFDTTLRDHQPLAEGQLGADQKLWAEQKLDEEKRRLGGEYQRFTKVAIMHHHCIPVPGSSTSGNRFMQMLDAADMLDLLNTYKFDLVLHGHMHVPHMTKSMSGDGRYITYVGAGTVLAPYSDQRGSYGNSFNVIVVNQSSSELAVSRWDVRDNGSFSEVVGPKRFPLGRVNHDGFRTGKVRRLTRIGVNGDTHIVLERSGFIVIGDNRIKQVPIRFSTPTPKAKICNFKATSNVDWFQEDDALYDGFSVFDQVRTAEDGPIDLHYEYDILNGTMMSLDHMTSVGLPVNSAYEESVISVSGDVQRIHLEIEFPSHYDCHVKVIFEKLGVDLPSWQFEQKYELTHDKFMNRWTFLMDDPPSRHGITLRWDLPKSWTV